MLVKTRGIVLRFIRFRESSIIANVYTEEQGLQGYVVNGVRSSRSKRNKIALYQPLTMLDMVVYSREGKSLQRLSETRCSYPFSSIPINPKKAAIALFLVEVLSKTLKEQTENKALFEFIWESIIQFDHSEDVPENFHLVFLVKLARYLGFNPYDANELYEELKFQLDHDWINSPEAERMDKLLNCSYSTSPKLTNRSRASLLNVLLSLYTQHVEQFGNVKSVSILNQVFS